VIFISQGKRLYEQYVAILTSLSAAATHKADILTGLASSYREARQQGADGVLEPNEVVQPENTVQNEVPEGVRFGTNRPRYALPWPGSKTIPRGR